MSRSKVKLQVSSQDRAALNRACQGGKPREQKRAAAILSLATGNHSYRATAASLQMSTSSVIGAVQKFRQGGIQALLRIHRPSGRPSGMKQAGVKEFLIELLNRVGAIDVETILAELKNSPFQIKLRPKSLRYWLSKWKLKLPVRARVIPMKALQPDVVVFIKAELKRVEKEKKHALYYFPEDKRELKSLEIQQDQLMVLTHIQEGGYTQADLADKYSIRVATINRWLQVFWKFGAGEAAVNKLLDMHPTERL
jgi:transposase